MEKILTFVIKNHKILLLLGSENDPQFHKSFWYVVTGGCEDRDKSLKETLKEKIEKYV